MDKHAENLGRTQDSYFDLLERALWYSRDYVRELPNRPVSPLNEDLEALETLNTALPEEPTKAVEMLATLHRIGGRTTMPTTAGRYFGFVTGGAHPPAVAAKWMASVWDQNGGLFVLSPIACKMEEIAERWVVDLLRLPEGTAAGFVSGTTTALASAFVTARDALLDRIGWNTPQKGLFGAPELRVIVGEHAHSSVYKALSYVGLGQDRVEIVEADDQGRMRADRLPELDERSLVIAQAGNVNSGSFDPIDEICEAARAVGAWVHVDGAFGLWAASSSKTAKLVAGIDKADSWATDAHKTLNAPYDSGIFLCRDRDLLRRSMAASGAYLQFSEEQRDGSNYTPELSRRARAIELWATIQTLGRTGVADLVDHLCLRAADIAEGLASAGFRIVADVVFNQVLVACDHPDETLATLKMIQSQGTIWCGSTDWFGEPVIRVSVCSWATNNEDVSATIRAFKKARETVLL